MERESMDLKEAGLGLKEPAGWFAAGDSFRQAMIRLSDGAFKLFAYLCLQADRRTGQFQATHKELATALAKSKRIIGSYVVELEQKDLCRVRPGKNQFASTVFEISDGYWPYRKPADSPDRATRSAYVEAVAKAFLAIECGSGRFSSADERIARNLQQRGIRLEVVQDAILVGACRKYISLLNSGPSESIASLSYFESVIAEIQEQPFPEGYREHLRMKTERLARTWREQIRSGRTPSNGGCPGMDSPEIVQ